MNDPFELSDEPEEATPSAPPPTVYLDSLNNDQRQAVEAIEGPVLVLAGAGTGKTRVLTTRLSHILIQGHAYPGEILAVTFTNKAAKEMQERVAQMVDRNVDGWWLGTFHALCVRILRSHGNAIGIDTRFTILDTDDQIRLLKQILRERNIDTKAWPPRALLNIIQRWKDRGLVPDKVVGQDGEDFADGLAIKLYKEYQTRMASQNTLDFGDLILHCLTLFTGHPEILKVYQERFRYILVDEYQDTNVAQYLWLRLLAQKHRNICCVGDDDQSIYSWRGAEVGNILRFEEDFPGATVIRLERNYRSTGHILGAASGLIAHNEGRLGKTLWTEDPGGDKVVVQAAWDGQEEARLVGEEIEVMQTKGFSLGEMAILVRTGFQTREFEERLMTLGVPYRIIGGLRFYERKEIRDAVAYLRVIFQPGDSLAFERIVNLPKRGIGQATMQIIHQFARSADKPLIEAIEVLLETDELKPRAKKPLGALLEDFTRWRAMAEVENHADVLETVLDESGYLEMWRMDRTPEAPGKIENLKELITALTEFDSLEDFLEHVSLVMENERANEGEKVTMMTLHGAKGLEFDVVFLPGWEEKLFPHQLSLDEKGRDGLEEERRLAYVGITRARKKSYILHAANRRVYNEWRSNLPSRFVDELSEEHVLKRNKPGLYGNNQGGGQSASLRETGPSFSYGSYGRKEKAAKINAEPSFSTSDEKYSAGQRVFHQKFGYGRVLNSDGGKLQIAFEKAGVKKVMENFVEEA
ncbi:MAG: UvrD-helicase domain-containing protein [Alphaproteobacteria bacterium]|nr:UvrD-helicase domain-containing protein [Alphaproteobacteria bacterium]